jgi:hypothetical protein
MAEQRRTESPLNPEALPRVRGFQQPGKLLGRPQQRTAEQVETQFRARPLGANVEPDRIARAWSGRWNGGITSEVWGRGVKPTGRRAPARRPQRPARYRPPRYAASGLTISAGFEVPTALVTFTDEGRQWFKAGYGFPVAGTPEHADLMIKVEHT